jgi:hypothetical protein
MARLAATSEGLLTHGKVTEDAAALEKNRRGNEGA